MYSHALAVRLLLQQRNSRSQPQRQYKTTVCKPAFPVLQMPGGTSLQNYNAIRIITYMYAREVRDLYKDFA